MRKSKRIKFGSAAMKTEMLKIDPELLEANKIHKIADVLRRDGTIAYPTETFYGLGAAALSSKAVRKIYRLKSRVQGKPLSIVVSDLQMARDMVTEIPPLFGALAQEFWPGPLTLVVKASSVLPRDLLGRDGTIGLRQPSPAWLRELVRQMACPLTATSANISGEREISDPREVIRLFYGKVSLVVDGGLTPGTLPSTVVDLSRGKAEILREGAVPRSKLKKYLEI
jgi:L-threonylcarbamoyladenylate synthase